MKIEWIIVGGLVILGLVILAKRTTSTATASQTFTGTLADPAVAELSKALTDVAKVVEAQQAKIDAR